jgi:hypothetical protein
MPQGLPLTHMFASRGELRDESPPAGVAGTAPIPQGLPLEGHLACGPDTLPGGRLPAAGSPLCMAGESGVSRATSRRCTQRTALGDNTPSRRMPRAAVWS